MSFREKCFHGVHLSQLCAECGSHSPPTPLPQSSDSTVLASIRKRIGDGWFAGGVTHDVAVARKLGVLETEVENYHAALTEALEMLRRGDMRAEVIELLHAELVTNDDMLGAEVASRHGDG